MNKGLLLIIHDFGPIDKKCTPENQSATALYKSKKIWYNKPYI